MNIHTLVIIAANLLISLRGFRDYSFFEQYKFSKGKCCYNIGADKREHISYQSQTKSSKVVRQM